MKRIFIYLLLLSSNVLAQIGIEVETATEMLDVNGRVRIRDTNPLTSINQFPIYEDSNGVIGIANLNPNGPKIAFVSSTSNISIISDFNAGNIIQLPITNNRITINTLDAPVINNSIRISEKGFYQMTGSLNTILSTGSIDSRVFLGCTIQKSSDGGSTWEIISGIRPVYIMAAAANINYNTVLPTIIVELNENDLIRLVVNRTRNSSGVLEGANLTAGSVNQNIDHGTKSYCLSLTKVK
jgi:hypothetical protein